MRAAWAGGSRVWRLRMHGLPLGRPVLVELQEARRRALSGSTNSARYLTTPALPGSIVNALWSRSPRSRYGAAGVPATPTGLTRTCLRLVWLHPTRSRPCPCWRSRGCPRWRDLPVREPGLLRGLMKADARYTARMGIIAAHVYSLPQALILLRAALTPPCAPLRGRGRAQRQAQHACYGVTAGRAYGHDRRGVRRVTPRR